MNVPPLGNLNGGGGSRAALAPPQLMELEHAIGLSVATRYSLQGLAGRTGSSTSQPSSKYAFILGSSVAIADAADPHSQTFVRAHEGPLTCVRVSPNGQWMATGEVGLEGRGKSEVCLWDTATLGVTCRFMDQQGGIVALDFSSDNTMLVSIGGGDGRIAVYDVSNGGLIAHWAGLGGALAGAPAPASNGKSTAPAISSTMMAASLIRDLCFGPKVEDIKRRELQQTYLAICCIDCVLIFTVDPFQGTVAPNAVPLKLGGGGSGTSSALGITGNAGGIGGTSGYVRKYTCCQFSQFGDILFIGSEAGDVAAVNMLTGAVVSILKVCPAAIRSIVLVPDVSAAAGTGGQNASGAAAGGGTDGFRYARFGPGSERSSLILVAGADGTVAQLSVPNHTAPQLQLVKVTSLNDTVCGLALLDNGASSVTAIAVTNGGVTDVLRGFTSAASGGASAAPAAAPQARGGNNNGASLVKVEQIADALTCTTSALATHPSQYGTFVTASKGGDACLRQWDLNTYRVVGMYQLPSERVYGNSVGTSSLAGGGGKSAAAQTVVGGPGQQPACTAISISDGLEILLSSWTDGAVRGYDMTNREHLWSHSNAHRSGLTSLCVSPSMKFYVTGAAEGDIRAWDIRSRQLKCELKDHRQEIVKLCLLSDDRHMLSASRDRTVITWDLLTSKRLTCHECHTGPLTDMVLASSATGSIGGGGGGGAEGLFLTSGLDSLVVLWDVRQREPARKFSYGSGVHCLSMASSPDGRLLATGGTDECVRLYDWRFLCAGGGSFNDTGSSLGSSMGGASSAAPLTISMGHSGAVEKVVWTGDGKQVITAGTDRSVMVWNVYA